MTFSHRTINRRRRSRNEHSDSNSISGKAHCIKDSVLLDHMKALFVNGSPRKGWNTTKLLEKAMEGAAEAGVNIDDKPFKGYVFGGSKAKTEGRALSC